MAPRYDIGDPKAYINSILLAIAAYNVTELAVWIFTTFYQRKGLYFYSILSSTFLLAIYTSLSFQTILSDNQAAVKPANYLWTFTYPALFTTHILVLYSRLHVVLPHSRILRAVLILIIVTSAILIPAQITIAILASEGNEAMYVFQETMEIIGIAVAVAREVVICTIYIFQALRNLAPVAEAKGPTGRRIMIYLVTVQVAILVLDVGLLVQLFLPVVESATGFSALVFSLKLKMEFGILNALVTLVTSQSTVNFGVFSTIEGTPGESTGHVLSFR